MKIFGISKKQLKQELLECREANKDLIFINEEYKKYINKLTDLLDEKNAIIRKINGAAHNALSETKINGAKGGLTAENNKLKKSVEELTKKLEESMSDKYRVRKIPSGRRPKAAPMRIKSNAVQSKIVKKVYEEAKDE